MRNLYLQPHLGVELPLREHILGLGVKRDFMPTLLIEPADTPPFAFGERCLFVQLVKIIPNSVSALTGSKSCVVGYGRLLNSVLGRS